MEKQIDRPGDPDKLDVVFPYGTHDSREKWKILSYDVLNHDIVLFTCEHIETGEITPPLEAGRGGWEWGIGEMLDLSVYGL